MARCDVPACGVEAPSVGELAGHLIDAHEVPASEALRRARDLAGKIAPAPPIPADLPFTQPKEAPMSRFKPRPCPECDERFTPTGAAQKRCPTCSEKRKGGSSVSNAAKAKRSGGGKRESAKPEPAAPRNGVVGILDGEIAKLERQLEVLKGARAVLA